MSEDDRRNPDRDAAIADAVQVVRMRDGDKRRAPERIEVIIGKVRDLWEWDPDLRLLQLL